MGSSEKWNHTKSKHVVSWVQSSFIPNYTKLSPDSQKDNSMNLVPDTSPLTEFPRTLCKKEEVNRIVDPVIHFIFYFQK